MERIETDCTADSGGVVHIQIGKPGKRVHVVVDDAPDCAAPFGTWLAQLADHNPNRPPIPLASLDRGVVYAREHELP